MLRLRSLYAVRVNAGALRLSSSSSSSSSKEAVDVDVDVDVFGVEDVDASSDAGAAGTNVLSSLGTELPELDELWQEYVIESNAKKAVELSEHEVQELERRASKVVDAAGRAYGTGRRKSSVSRVWVSPAPAGGEEGGEGVAPAKRIVVNSVPLAEYFPSLHHRMHVLEPFRLLDNLGEFSVRATVKGGGHTGQAGALRLGIARALEIIDPELRAPLKAAGMMKRDPRMVERKKAGRKKARKSFTWVKR